LPEFNAAAVAQLQAMGFPDVQLSTSLSRRFLLELMQELEGEHLSRNLDRWI